MSSWIMYDSWDDAYISMTVILIQGYEIHHNKEANIRFGKGDKISRL